MAGPERSREVPPSKSKVEGRAGARKIAKLPRKAADGRLESHGAPFRMLPGNIG
jgi:hypothetical protein